jgi:hypothetical protein
LLLAGLSELINRVEPNLLYELIWVDQATVDRASLSRLSRFDRKFLFAQPVGYSISLRLAFLQCTREYIFILGKHWLAVNISLPWFSFSMDVLAHVPESMYGVLLLMVPVNGRIYKTTIQSCFIPSGTIWRFDHKVFHLATWPAVYRMSSIKEILNKLDCLSDYKFASLARALGYTVLIWTDDITRSNQLPLLFRHIGLRSSQYKKPSTCEEEIRD